MPNTLSHTIWGGIPNWWRIHPKFNGKSVGFISTTKIHEPHLKDCSLYIVPANCYVEQRDFDSKVTVRPTKSEYFWMVGIGWYGETNKPEMAILKYPRGSFLLLNEDEVTKLLKTAPSKHILREFIANQLKAVNPLFSKEIILTKHN